MKVLFEDNHLLAVDKPAGMPVQADESGADDALTLARAYIKERWQKPGAVYLGLVHRLDRPVSGVLLFARTSKAAARLSEQFRARTARKEYHAVVVGVPPPAGTWTDCLRKDEATRMVSVVAKDAPGGQDASLAYEVLCTRNGLSLLRIDLHTGRPHQIRVQCQSRGFPIWADARYGAALPGADIALRATRLAIEHPTLRTQTVICAPLPGAPPWSLF